MAVERSACQWSVFAKLFFSPIILILLVSQNFFATYVRSIISIHLIFPSFLGSCCQIHSLPTPFKSTQSQLLMHTAFLACLSITSSQPIILPQGACGERPSIIKSFASIYLSSFPGVLAVFPVLSLLHPSPAK